MQVNKLVTTYSIIAVDSKHGEMGGAVQSHYFSVGSVVLWALPAGNSGRQSACIRIVSTERKDEVFKDYPLDLRVEDNAEPLMEMRRLLNIHRAYEHTGFGDAALEKNNIEKALAEYSYAEKLDPKNNELKYWHGLALAGSGRVEDALDILREVYKNNSSWRELTRRVAEAGIIRIDAETLKKII